LLLVFPDSRFIFLPGLPAVCFCPQSGIQTQRLTVSPQGKSTLMYMPRFEGPDPLGHWADVPACVKFGATPQVARIAVQPIQDSVWTAHEYT